MVKSRPGPPLRAPSVGKASARVVLPVPVPPPAQWSCGPGSHRPASRPGPGPPRGHACRAPRRARLRARHADPRIDGDTRPRDFEEVASGCIIASPGLKHLQLTRNPYPIVPGREASDAVGNIEPQQEEVELLHVTEELDRRRHDTGEIDVIPPGGPA